MPDDRDLDDLRHLAPDVDAGTARAEFDRRRREDRPPRWPLAAAAAVVLVLLAGGFAIAANGRDDDTVVAGVDEAEGQPEPSGPDVGNAPTSTMEVPPVTVPGLCSDVERFAERLTDTGITYDATVAQSPSELLERSDVAFRGYLTGRTVAVGSQEADFARVGYEAEIVDLFAGPPGAELTREQTIWVDHAPWIDAELSQETAIPGIPVFVFAEYVERPAERFPILMTGIDGFVTACDEGPLLGFVSQQGEWADIETLDELETRLSADCGEIEAFADVVEAASAIYDYDASESPEELLASSELVFLGRLTGEHAVVEADPDTGTLPQVAVDVEVEKVFKSPDGADPDGVRTIRFVAPPDLDVEVAPGIPVVVFADIGPDGPQAGPEGFVTACPEGPLRGFPTFNGDWTEIDSILTLDLRLGAAASG